MLRFVEDRMPSRTAARYARVVGAVPAIESGPRPFAIGSTVPGFAVTALDPERELVLTGRHRFAGYQLVFRVRTAPASTASAVESATVEVESRAEFPGVLGGLYRVMVVVSRFHVLAVRRILRAVAREAAVDSS